MIKTVSTALTKRTALVCSIKLIKSNQDDPLYIYSGITHYDLKNKNNIVFLSLKIGFVLANSSDPDEMLHNAVFYLGVHCLPKYLICGFPSANT